MSENDINPFWYKRLYKPKTEMKKSIKIKSSYSLWKRIWVLIKNPFTYIFCGYIEH